MRYGDQNYQLKGRRSRPPASHGVTKGTTSGAPLAARRSRSAQTFRDDVLMPSRSKLYRVEVRSRSDGAASPGQYGDQPRCRRLPRTRCSIPSPRGTWKADDARDQLTSPCRTDVSVMQLPTSDNLPPGLRKAGIQQSPVLAQGRAVGSGGGTLRKFVMTSRCLRTLADSDGRPSNAGYLRCSVVSRSRKEKISAKADGRVPEKKTTGVTGRSAVPVGSQHESPPTTGFIFAAISVDRRRKPPLDDLEAVESSPSTRRRWCLKSTAVADRW